MWKARQFREILIAELTLMRGLAEPRDVAAALQRYWDKRGERDISLTREIARIAGLLPAALAGVEKEVDRLVAEAEGDPRLALLSHEGRSRFVETGLTQVCPPSSTLGADPARVRLRTMPEGRYQEYLPAGEGGMGIVYWALDTELNRQVAFKVVRPRSGAGDKVDTPAAPMALTPPPRGTPASRAFEELKTRFLQEAWVTGGMEHPGIVPVYEVGQTGEGVPYYTMRFVRGERTLRTAIREVQGKPFETRLLLIEPFLKVCDTVHYAHSRGVIHRDLKPANIGLGQFGEVVVLDWGLAKFGGPEDPEASRWQEKVQEFRASADLETYPGALGTPGYMSPEATRGQTALIDERSDVYGLGVILYEILTGRTPFESRSLALYAQQVTEGPPRPPAELNDAIPGQLSEICLNALAMEPTARPVSADVLADSIRRWQSHSAMERELKALVREAEGVLESLESLDPDAALDGLSRVTDPCNQALRIHPDHPEANDLLERTEALRHRGMHARDGALTRVLYRRVAVAALIILTLGAGAIAYIVEGRRKALKESAVREAGLLAAANAAAEENANLATTLAGSLRRTQGLGLVHASSRIASSDPTLALLLGLEAAKVDPSAAALTRIHEVMGHYIERATMTGHTGPVSTAVYSPDGTRILTASDDHTARMWTSDGRPLAELKGHARPVTRARFSADGRRIVTASLDGTVRVWDRDGTQVRVLGPYEHAIDDVQVSPDGLRLLTRSSGAPAIAPTPSDTPPVPVPTPGPPKITITLRSIHGTSLATRELPWTHDGAVFRAPHQALYLDIAGSELHVKDLETGRVIQVIPHDDVVTHALLSPDARRVVSTCDQHTVLLSATDGEEITRFRAGPMNVTRVEFSGDGSRILTRYPDRTIGVWDTDGHALAVTYHANQNGPAPWYDMPDDELIVAIDGMQVAVHAVPTPSTSMPAPAPDSVPAPGQVEPAPGPDMPPVRPLHPAAPTPVAPAPPPVTAVPVAGKVPPADPFAAQPPPAPAEEVPPSAPPAAPALEVFPPDAGARQTAPRLASGETRTADLTIPQESRWYRFEAVSGKWHAIETSAVSLQDSVLLLHDATGRHLVTDDDGGPGNMSRIVRRLDAGLHFVRVAGFGNHTGTYRVTLTVTDEQPPMPEPPVIVVEELPVAPAPSGGRTGEPRGESVPPAAAAPTPPYVAPDEAARSNAVLLEPDQELTATIESPGDPYWFRLEARVRKLYSLSTLHGSILDTVLHLYRADDTHVQSDDDSGGNRTSRINRVLDPGTYYVAVRAYKADRIGTCRIRLRISDVPVVVGIPAAPAGVAPGAAPATMLPVAPASEVFPRPPIAFEIARLVGHTGNITMVLTTPDGEGVLTTSWDGTVRLWRLQPAGEVPVMAMAGPQTLHLAEDGELVLSSYGDHIEFWKSDGRKLADRRIEEGNVRCIGWDDDTKYVAVGTGSGRVHLFRSNGDPLESFQVHEGQVHGITFMAPRVPGGDPRLVSYGDDRCVCIRELTPGRDPVRIQHNPYRPSGFAIAPKGGYVVTFAFDSPRDDNMPKDYGLFLWDTEGNPLTSLAGHGEPCQGVEISSDEEHILTRSAGSVRLWTRRGEEVAPRYDIKEGVSTDAFFSPDGIRIFEGDQHQGVTWIRRMDGSIVETVRTPPPAQRHYESKASGVPSPCAPDSPGGEPARRLARTRDGSKILVELDAGSISVMTHDGVELFGLPGGGETCGGVTVAEFSGSGDLLLVATTDSTRLLQLHVPTLLERVEEVVSRTLTDAERKMFRSLLEHHPTEEAE